MVCCFCFPKALRIAVQQARESFSRYRQRAQTSSLSRMALQQMRGIQTINPNRLRILFCLMKMQRSLNCKWLNARYLNLASHGAIVISLRCENSTYSDGVQEQMDTSEASDPGNDSNDWVDMILQDQHDDLVGSIAHATRLVQIFGRPKVSSDNKKICRPSLSGAARNGGIVSPRSDDSGAAAD